MKGRILIVEDDPAILHLIEANLTVAGYDAACAPDGAQAAAMVAHNCYDLALCDIMLPGLDGFE